MTDMFTCPNRNRDHVWRITYDTYVGHTHTGKGYIIQAASYDPARVSICCSAFISIQLADQSLVNGTIFQRGLTLRYHAYLMVNLYIDLQRKTRPQTLMIPVVSAWIASLSPISPSSGFIVRFWTENVHGRFFPEHEDFWINFQKGGRTQIYSMRPLHLSTFLQGKALEVLTVSFSIRYK